MIGALARQARKEMKAISSNALFRNKKALANFSWTTVWDEIVKEAPVLTNLLSSLVAKPEENKAMLCMVANMFLKKHNKSLALVQKCISVFLYGNGCSKQVNIY